MGRWLKAALAATGVTLAAIQIVRPPRTNPPEQSGRSIHAASSMEPAVGSLLQRSCGDCHSNSTVWPWYSQVAPVSWLVSADVNRGRRALNLSEWAGYPPEQRAELLHDMCEEITQGEMPGSMYTALHRQARLTSADRQKICGWVHTAMGGTAATKVRTQQAESTESD